MIRLAPPRQRLRPALPRAARPCAAAPPAPGADDRPDVGDARAAADLGDRLRQIERDPVAIMVTVTTITAGYKAVVKKWARTTSAPRPRYQREGSKSSGV